MDEKHNCVRLTMRVYVGECVCVFVNMYVHLRAGGVPSGVSVCTLGMRVCSVMCLVMWRPAGDGPWREPAG